MDKSVCPTNAGKCLQNQRESHQSGGGLKVDYEVGEGPDG
jgi:hypothetical protein